MTVNRESYLDFLMRWKDKQIIKVVSGIRRCGKSTLFELYKSRLQESGVHKDQILTINFEDMANSHLNDYNALYDHVMTCVKINMANGDMTYVFLDEVQHVENFQKVVDSLFIQDKVDVYITGSNAYFMSGELATLLTGRYVELKMLPLSFSEYREAFPELPLDELYNRYVYNSSFPYTINLDNRLDVYAYLDGIYNTVVLNDIVARYNIKNIDSLKRVLKFLFDNIGNLTTSKKISDTMTSLGTKISYHTVDTYLDGVIESLLMYKVDRYDMRGKDYLKSNSKYYLSDVGLRYYLLGVSNVDQGRVLENIVYLELIRRGYRVSIGKYGTKEIDFVAVDDQGSTSYYQVTWSLRDESTRRREVGALMSVRDHSPKYIITMDNDPPIEYNGIKQIYALKWLLKEYE